MARHPASHKPGATPKGSRSTGTKKSAFGKKTAAARGENKSRRSGKSR